jgi:activator of 2-hydroxyglutaryl-CoA dehydratase
MYDVLCLLYDGEAPQRIASGVCMAMAERISKLAKRVGIRRDVAMTGGVAKNVAVVANLKDILGVEELELPGIDPQIIGALGAALFARERAIRERRDRASSGDVK